MSVDDTANIPGTNIPDTAGWDLLFADIFLAIIALVIVSFLIIHAAKFPGPARYIAPLAILSGIAMIIGGINDMDALITIAAGGVGALGAVLQAVTKTGRQDVLADPPDEPYDDEDDDLPD